MKWAETPIFAAYGTALSLFCQALFVNSYDATRSIQADA